MICDDLKISYLSIQEGFFEPKLTDFLISFLTAWCLSLFLGPSRVESKIARFNKWLSTVQISKTIAPDHVSCSDESVHILLLEVEHAQHTEYLLVDSSYQGINSVLCMFDNY